MNLCSRLFYSKLLFLPVLVLANLYGKNEEAVMFPEYTPTGSEPRVAVLDLDNGTFFENDRIGKAVAAMIETELVQSKRCSVVERQNTAPIL